MLFRSLEFFKALDIDASVVRTAMSRLTADGWFERSKAGRNSFYRLVQSGRQTFDIATKQLEFSGVVAGPDKILSNSQTSRKLIRRSLSCSRSRRHRRVFRFILADKIFDL